MKDPQRSLPRRVHRVAAKQACPALAGAIAGAGAGGAAGTLIGALIGAGIPEERAKAYDAGIRGGGIVLGTRARDAAHAAELERDFTTYGGRDIRR